HPAMVRALINDDRLHLASPTGLTLIWFGGGALATRRSRKTMRSCAMFMRRVRTERSTWRRFQVGSRHGAMTPRGLRSTLCRRPRGRESHPGRSHYMLTSLFRRVVIVLGSLLATLPSLYGAALAQPFLDDSVSVAIDRMSQAAGAPVQTRR